MVNELGEEAAQPDGAAGAACGMGFARAAPAKAARTAIDPFILNVLVEMICGGSSKTIERSNGRARVK